MGARGPTPKSPDRRQRRAPLEVVRLDDLRPVDDAPPLPGGRLLKKTKERWVAFWGSALARAIDRETDLPALHRLWTLYDERERCYRAFRKERLVPGSQGQLVLNPLGRQMSALDPEIRALEDRFGLTPMARQRLGLAFATTQRTLDDLNRETEEDEDDGGEDPRDIVDVPSADPRS